MTKVTNNTITVEEVRRKAVPILKKAHITRAGIFGSIARGEAKEKSDIDMLIDFDDAKTLFDLARLQRELEAVLHRKVDLITYRSLYSRLRNIIEREEVAIM